MLPSCTSQFGKYSTADWKVQHGRGDVLSVAFSPDGQLLVSSGWDGATRFWRVKDGGLVGTLGTGTNPLSFSPDGQILAASDEVI